MKGKGSFTKKIKNRLLHIKDDNSGVAMIVSLVVGIVVLAFTLSLLMVAYSLYAQMNRKTIALQCKLIAQNFSEVLGEELKDPNSEIVQYLSKQLSDGVWVSKEEADTGITSPGTVGELVLDMTNGDLGSYHIQVKFSYTLNEDVEDLGPDNEDDDQDENGSNNDDSSGNGNDEGGGGNEDPRNGNYDITAEIRCYKGSLDGNDTQSFIVIISEYRSIGL